jgi:drug/metabolite transporter (DMT)-like permease
VSVAVARSRAPSPGWALVTATIAVSFSAILIKAADDDPATIVWLRMGMAAVLLVPWVVRDLRRGVLPQEPREIAMVVVSGVLLAGHFLLWTSTPRSPPASSSCRCIL